MVNIFRFLLNKVIKIPEKVYTEIFLIITLSGGKVVLVLALAVVLIPAIVPVQDQVQVQD